MDKSLEELIGNWRTAEQAFKDCQEKIISMTAKADFLEQETPDKSRQLGEAKAIKEKALDDFVDERISQTALDEAREAFEQAQNKFTEHQELVSATYRGAKRAQEELPGLGRAVETGRIRVWQFITNDLKEKALAAIGDKLTRFLIANAQAGGGGSQGFFNMPPIDESNRIRMEIEDEYLGRKVNGKEKKGIKETRRT